MGYAGDSYKLIEQDSHSIWLNGKYMYEMVGNFQIFGDSYEIYDKNKKLIATAEFNMTNTSGTIHDVDNNLIAEYKSGLLSKDYTVKIYKNCIMEEDAMLLICASFFSDFDADSHS